MSRPQNLPLALQTWALANYPAGSGSWSNQPMRLAPAAPLVPGATIPGPIINYLDGYAFDVAQGALNMVGQMPAMNWGPLVSPGSTSLSLAGWSDFEQAWYLFASSTTGYRSLDFGKTWQTFTGGPNPEADVVFDNLGYGVVSNNAGGISVGTPAAFNSGSAASWTSYTGVTSASNGANLAWDAATGQFMWLGAGNGSGSSAPPHAYYSLNRTTWVALTLPTTWSSSLYSPTVGADGLGHFVAAFADTATTFRTILSTGTAGAWTNDQQLNPGIGGLVTSSPVCMRPTWSSVDALWYYIASSTSSAALYSSPNGITWTLVRTLPLQVLAFAVLGSLVVILDSRGFISVSVNKGLTFGKCGATGAGQTTFMRSGGGGLLVVNNTQTAASQRFGMPTASF